MQIGVSSYSYSRLIRSGEMTEFDAVRKTAELGYDVIEFSSLHPPEGQSFERYAPEVRAACDEAGLPIANYTVGADFINGSGGNWKDEVERVKDEVRIAHLLGTPGMRHDATRGFAGSRPGGTFIRRCPGLTRSGDPGGHGVRGGPGRSDHGGESRHVLPGQRSRGKTGQRRKSRELRRAHRHGQLPVRGRTAGHRRGDV